MHSIEIPELDETSYTRFNKTLSSTIPQWNTRDISTEWIFIHRHQMAWFSSKNPMQAHAAHY